MKKNIMVLLILGLLTFGCVTEEGKYTPDDGILNMYLSEKANLNYQSGNEGMLFYDKDGKDYAIECKSRIVGDTLLACCKEGEVIWGQKYDVNTMVWIEYIHNTCPDYV